MNYRGGERGRGRGGPPGGRGGGGRGGYAGTGAGQRDQGGGVFSPGPANIDPRLTDGSDQALVDSFRSLKINANDLPLRPGFGKEGKQVKLRANFFPVKVPKTLLYEYDVAISPTAGSANRRVKRRIFQLAEQSTDWSRYGLQGTVAHDHASKLIASKKLPQPIEIRVPFYDEDETRPGSNGKEYTLAITFIQNIDPSHLINYLAGQPQYRGYDILPIISALNIVLAAHPNRTSQGGGVLVGRNRFFFATAAAPPVPLGGGLQAWRGFYSSVRPSHNQLMVNVNVCTTAFYVPGNLAEAMVTFNNASFGARYTAFVKGVRVKTTHLGYKKTVKSVSNLLPKQHTFDCEELGGKVNVEQYFLKKYRYKIRYPQLPLIDVGGQKANLLPPEVCEILPNQPFKGKLSDENTAAMIKAAAKPPNINATAIMNAGLNELGFRQGAAPLGAFGISIGPDMTVVPGRILPTPGITYSIGHPDVDANKASWNLRNVKFLKGGKLARWLVLLIADGNHREEFSGPDDPELKQTVNGFTNMCKNSGMSVEPPMACLSAALPVKERADPIRSQAIDKIRATLRSHPQKPNFVLVILSSSDKHVYAGLKHLCDAYLDVPTVCVHAGKIRKDRGQMQYFANVALKVNIKTGGANHALDKEGMKWLHAAQTMLVGIDVTHPGPGSVRGTPSIAAVVASVDSYFAQFPASMQLQESKKEMVTNLAVMMFERLTLFRSRNRRLPERVLVYRDGVSEGQLMTVVEEEMPAIRAAFRKFDTPQQKYSPKLSIVVCGKRHHTRFYPTDAAGADSNGNPKPGTVVDRGVTAVYNFDFFLQAHAGLHGTTRPTHYYVVYDDIGFKADELQTLTNHISYLYSRATKAVSLASPAYYADMACERGRCYIHKLLQGITNVNLNHVDAENLVMEEAQRLWNNGVSGPVMKDTMYYL
ncbi:argonaute-like protein [Guyanagaster necrorhizus]|uniref:Argonaute-like protein n=1 Tax=Guyanagaster necrorhizus TaxID=856835 RepID=A0A9P7W1D2_9AGAR|nr:argonaute-like protein [Guyanagaster necrorhizus MCA 3950]KAG7450179.1 argonaute-like protein [Guyanagaster necrorhizus MCA 3950]